VSRTHQPAFAGAQSMATVSVTCVTDGRAHAVPDSELTQGVAHHSGYYSAVCGHMVAAAPMSAPDGEPCRSCADLWSARHAVRRQQQRLLSRIFG
jgi:hypothetical protein